MELKTQLKDVDYEYAYFLAYENELRKVNDLFSGNQAIKRRGEHYLFKMSRENNDKYKERLRSATLYNCFKGAINNYKNLILRKGINLKHSEKFGKIFRNIDGQGNNVQTSIDNSTRDALIDGMSFLWVDAPKVSGVVSLKDVFTSGFRPFIKNIKRTNVINIQTQKVAGIETLTRFVIKEDRIIPSDSFKEEVETVYIVLERNQGYICKKIKYKAFEVIASWENELGYIPIIPVYSEKTGFMKAAIPLTDLADLNLKYYNATSEKDHIKTLSCNPQPILYGYETDEDTEEIIIGVNNAIIMSDKTTQGAEYLEVTGKSLDYLNADLESLENKLDRMSLTVVYSNTFKTATEANLNEEKSSLFLVELSNSIENAYNLAFLIMNEYMGLDLGASIELTKDFVSKKIDAVMVDTLLKLKVEGAISIETLWDALVNGETLDRFDYALEKNKIEAQREEVVL